MVLEPGSVAFFEFGSPDLDSPVVLTPTNPDRKFWQKTFQVAIGDLASLVAPRELILCEGALGRGFDAKCLNAIFGSTYSDTEFVSIGASNDVQHQTVLTTAVVNQVLPGVTLRRLIDRDDHSDDEVAAMRTNGIFVLSRRHLESYLFDDSILEKLCGPAAPEIIQYKQELLNANAAKGRPSDDIKSIAGQLYVLLKKQLGLTQCGNSAPAFALEKLVPLITQETAVFAELQADIWGRT